LRVARGELTIPSLPAFRHGGSRNLYDTSQGRAALWRRVPIVLRYDWLGVLLTHPRGARGLVRGHSDREVSPAGIPTQKAAEEA